jgi:hypothetical protein
MGSLKAAIGVIIIALPPLLDIFERLLTPLPLVFTSDT